MSKTATWRHVEPNETTRYEGPLSLYRNTCHENPSSVKRHPTNWRSLRRSTGVSSPDDMMPLEDKVVISTQYPSGRRKSDRCSSPDNSLSYTNQTHRIYNKEKRWVKPTVYVIKRRYRGRDTERTHCTPQTTIIHRRTTFVAGVKKRIRKGEAPSVGRRMMNLVTGQKREHYTT